MTSALDGELQRVVDDGPRVVFIDCELCQRSGDVEQRKRMGGSAQIVANSHGLCAKLVEDFQFKSQRAVAGIGDLRFDLAEFGGGEADLSRKRLAVNKCRVERRGHQLVAVLRRDLNEIAQHVVVPDLESLDAGVVGVARLHCGDHQPRSVAQAAGFVERRFIARTHKAAIALEQRQFVGKAACEFPCEIAGWPTQRVDRERDVARQLVDPR